MKTIKQKYSINAPVKTVWQGLVSPKIINKWGGGPVSMDDQVGTEFTLWGGDIHGKNIKVSQNKELIQEWCRGDWDQPSKVTFTLKEKGSKTDINLLHENVPDEEAANIDDGWKTYYLDPLKELLEK